MAIQPGVGFSFTSSGHGTTLDINAGYTDPAPTVPVEQFKVVMDGNKVYVAKGRVLARCGDFVTDLNYGFDTILYVEQCLKEFNVKNFAVYPTGSITEGTNLESLWASDEGYVDVETEHIYGVYLVMNQFDAAGAYTPGAPYLAVIADDDANEALEKSRPYGDNGCDSVKYYGVATLIEQGGDGPYYIYVQSGSPLSPAYAFNYNCQRVKIATIEYGGDPARWTITQHLIGTLTIPSQFNYMGNDTIRLTAPDISPEVILYNPFDPGPLFSAQNTAWNGAWAGYDKSFTGATEEIAL